MTVIPLFTGAAGSNPIDDPDSLAAFNKLIVLLNSIGLGIGGTVQIIPSSTVVQNNNHVTTGGVVQFVTLALGAPPDGYELVNCDPTTWMFLSETTSGWVDGPAIGGTSQLGPGADGWTPVPPFGGYGTPLGYQPNPARGIAIYSPLTGHRFSWKSW